MKRLIILIGFGIITVLLGFVGCNTEIIPEEAFTITPIEMEADDCFANLSLEKISGINDGYVNKVEKDGGVSLSGFISPNPPYYPLSDLWVSVSVRNKNGVVTGVIRKKAENKKWSVTIPASAWGSDGIYKIRIQPMYGDSPNVCSEYVETPPFILDTTPPTLIDAGVCISDNSESISMGIYYRKSYKANDWRYTKYSKGFIVLNYEGMNVKNKKWYSTNNYIPGTYKYYATNNNKRITKMKITLLDGVKTSKEDSGGFIYATFIGDDLDKTTLTIDKITVYVNKYKQNIQTIKFFKDQSGNINIVMKGGDQLNSNSAYKPFKIIIAPGLKDKAGNETTSPLTKSGYVDEGGLCL